MAVAYTAIETVGDKLLDKALAQYGIHPDLILYIAGKSETVVTQESGTEVSKYVERCGFDSLESFANFEDAASVQALLRSFVNAVDATKGNFGELGKLRTCWNDIRKQLEAADIAPTKAEPVEEEDVDKPLEKAKMRIVRSSFVNLYSEYLYFDPRLTPCDSLIGRIYREFEGGSMTLLPISKVRTILMDKTPKEKRKVNLGSAAGGTSITLNVDDDGGVVAMSSIYEYYMGLTILMNTWSLVGTTRVTSSLQTTANPPPKVLMFEHGRGVAYAGFALRSTLERAPPGRALAWLENKDLHTRAIVVSRAREGIPVGEALGEALKELKEEWKSPEMDRSRSPHHSLAGSAVGRHLRKAEAEKGPGTTRLSRKRTGQAVRSSIW